MTKDKAGSPQSLHPLAPCGMLMRFHITPLPQKASDQRLAPETLCSLGVSAGRAAGGVYTARLANENVHSSIQSAFCVCQRMKKTEIGCESNQDQIAFVVCLTYLWR